MTTRTGDKLERHASEAPQASPSLRGTRQTRWFLCLICFLSGTMTLVIEIAGTRLLSPLFGNSLFTWTALIGVVLVAMSVGDYLGGVLVDRAPRFALLGYLLLSASTWTLAVPWLHGFLRETTARAGVISGPLLASLLLFAVPACLLAASGPFIVRLLSRTRADHEIGLSAGLVGMLTTLGSFSGTLLTGFWLIPLCGVRTIFLLAGLLIGGLGVAVLAWCRTTRTIVPVAAIAAMIAFTAAHAASGTTLPAGVLHQEHTLYHELRVEESTSQFGERIRSLRLDTTLEGAQYVETGGISMTCNLYWRLAEVYCRRLDRGLFLGGGAFTMPEDFSRRHPNARSDVCEIDPAVIETGRRYFRLNEFPRVTATASDARRFLVDSDARYDFIFGDVYHGVRQIPPHVITQEFFSLVKSRLEDDGLFLMNIISPAQGEHSKLLHSIVKTLRTQFPCTQIYGTNASRPDEPQNVIILGAARAPRIQDRPAAAEDVTRHLLSTRLPDDMDEPAGAAILTDELNPADWMIAEQLLLNPHCDL